MNLNVWYWPFSTRYYLLHPWKWFSELFSNIRAAYRRARYGWCYMDAWEFDEWFLTVAPQIFRHIADYGCEHSGYDRFSEPEAWNTWLHSVADVLESLQEDNWYSQNKYDIDKEPKQWIEESKRLTEKRQYLLENTMKEISTEYFHIWG